MQTLQQHEEKRLISFIEKVTEKVSSLITEKSDYQPNFVCKDSQINFKLGRGESSLHWSICLSFCSFSYYGVCYNQLKLSVNDVVNVCARYKGTKC